MKMQKFWITFYWSIAGIVLWTILFLLGWLVAKTTIKDALTISSVVMIGFYSFAILLKLGFLEKGLISYRNSRFNLITNFEDPTKKFTLKEYRQDLKKRSWIPILVGIFSYLMILLVAILL